MGLQVAIISTKGGEFIAVAVRPGVLADDQRRRGVIDALAGLFPGREVVLVASTSRGYEVVGDAPEASATVRKKNVAKLNWQRYTAVPA